MGYQTKEEREAYKRAKDALRETAQNKLLLIAARVEARLQKGMSIKEELNLLQELRQGYEIHARECLREAFVPTQSMAMDCAEKAARLYSAVVPRLLDEERDLEFVPVTQEEETEIVARLTDIQA